MDSASTFMSRLSGAVKMFYLTEVVVIVVVVLEIVEVIEILVVI